MVKLESIINPDWLKYGLIGLVAIVNLLFYFIIRPLVATQPNKKFWIITFLVSSLIFLILGGVSSYTSDKMKFDNQRQVDSVELMNMDLRNKLSIYTDRTPEADSLKAKMEQNRKKYDSLINVNEQLEDDIEVQQGIISNLVINDIVQSLETDMIASAGKSDEVYEIQDVEFKRLRRAVFLNFLSFNADAAILEQTLFVYQKQNGEPNTKTIKRIIADLPNLMRVRLKWLKQHAIPELEADIAFLERKPMTQRSAFASVKLPNEAVIMKGTDDLDNTETVEDIRALQKEKSLLMKRLASL